MTLQQEYQERFQEGKEEGIREGIREGKIKGIMEGKIELLANDFHMTIPQIAQRLSISEAEVQQVLNHLKNQ